MFINKQISTCEDKEHGREHAREWVSEWERQRQSEREMWKEKKSVVVVARPHYWGCSILVFTNAPPPSRLRVGP